MNMTVRGIIFFAIYLFLVTLPLDTALLVNARAGTLANNIAAATGFLGLTLMATEFLLIARIKPAAQPFGEDALQLFHNIMGVVALVFLLAHPIFMIISGYPASCWLNPFSDCANSLTIPAALALYGLILLVISSAFRKQLRLRYEVWQIMHGVLAILIILGALPHIYTLGRFSNTQLMKFMWTVYAVIVVWVIAWFKIIRPILNWNKRWEVVENRAERGDARSLVLKPDGHEGFAFEPGQYAWVKKGRTPFGYGQHPISLSSNGDVAPGGTISFTIKNLGDWSGQVVPAIQPGEKLWVDGPHGVLSADREQGMGYVLIAGGVGITPLYAMCQTFAERGDVRPVLLFYGGRDYEGLTFREELDALKERMNLQVIYVLSDPKIEWQGERGFINAELLKRYLPEQYRRFVYFICGPEPLMNAMEQALPELGIPREKVLSERFGMV
ncbi:MAG: ferric reductase-like transmembrane domain-containing protein [Anaerolineales bacterium]|jgi:predicted ferric reductase